MKISVIIPTLNEQDILADTLTHTTGLGFDELIVVDGGSTDRTCAIAQSFVPVQPSDPRHQLPNRSPGPAVNGHWSMTTSDRLGPSLDRTRDPGLVEGQSSALSPVRLLASPPGRARQMNAGARAARGDVLLFLHADTRLPDDARAAITAALDNADCVGGRFDVQFDRPSRWAGVISFMMNLRSRTTGVSTGDQAIFVRRQSFEQLGGFPDQPLMEDIALTARLKRAGRVAALQARVTTSFRRWERRGPLRTILLMWGLRFLYWVGRSPAQLARWYGTVR